jgi:hypothetical protein
MVPQILQQLNVDPKTLDSLNDDKSYDIYHEITRNPAIISKAILHQKTVSEALTLAMQNPPPYFQTRDYTDLLPQVVRRLLSEPYEPSEASAIDACYIYAIKESMPVLLATLLSTKHVSSAETLGSCLVEASKKGDTGSIAMIIIQGKADPNALDGQPLVSAAQHGQLGSVEMLINQGANPKLNDSAALRAACASCEGPNVAAVVARLLISGSDLNSRAFEALRKAAAKGHPDVLKLLMGVVGNSLKGDKGAGNKNWEAKSMVKAVFDILVREGYAKALEAVLEDESIWGWEGGLETVVRPTLMQAIKTGQVEMVRALAGCERAWRDLVKGSEGRDTLKFAASVSATDDEVVKSLAKRQIDKSQVPKVKKDNKNNVESIAAAMVEAMVAGVAASVTARFHNFETNIGVDAWEYLRNAECTALHKIKDDVLLQAAWLGHETVVDAVLSILQPDIRGHAGSAALLAAVTQGHTKVVAGLISAGADYEAGSGEAFKVAEELGKKDVLKHLTLSREIRVRCSTIQKKRNTTFVR